MPSEKSKPLKKTTKSTARESATTKKPAAKRVAKKAGTIKVQTYEGWVRSMAKKTGKKLKKKKVHL